MLHKGPFAPHPHSPVRVRLASTELGKAFSNRAMIDSTSLEVIAP